MNTTGRWKLGLVLALTTTIFWAVLPVVLKVLLTGIDAVTITWCRFLAATVILGAFLAKRRRLPPISQFSLRKLLLLAIAIGGLLIDYLLYLLGLSYVSPETSQVVIQLAPLFLLLGGMVLFGETFGRFQWLGFSILIAGLLLFFNQRMANLSGGSREFYLGVGLTVAAAITWAAYALAQKQLLKTLESDQILLIIYAASVVLLLPGIHPASLASLDLTQWLFLLFACANTLVAYGAFAEAMVHWEASRVSAVLCTTPLFTFLSVWMVSLRFPEWAQPETLNPGSWAGAFLVVAGSTIAALGHRRPTEPSFPQAGQPEGAKSL